jgi:AcrR family transcriptional regulator
MNVERIVSLAVVLAVVVAMGVSATTLESSLSSDPDEVIDPNYESIPLGQDEVREARDEVEQNKQTPDPQGDPQSVPEEEQQPSGGDQGETQTEGPGDEQSLLQQLLALLLALLPYLLALLGLLVLAALAKRYGPRLLALLAALFPQDDGTSEEETTTWVPEPRNEIERAWLSMIEHAGVDQPRRRTPAEVANAAVAAGLDPEGVERLRSAFEKVRYGTESVTDEDARRAREGLRRMGLGGES